MRAVNAKLSTTARHLYIFLFFFSNQFRCRQDGYLLALNLIIVFYVNVDAIEEPGFTVELLLVIDLINFL